MITPSASFVRVASKITDKVAGLLYAPVFVTNEQGIVITSSDPHQIGLSFSWESSKNVPEKFLRIPLNHQAETGEVIVGAPSDEGTISPRLAQVLVELVINQTATHQNQALNQHELKNQLIYDLLHDRIRDENAILNRAKQLGMDLDPPRAVILIDAADYALRDNSSGQELLETEQRRRTQVIIGSIVSFFTYLTTLSVRI